MKTFSTEEIRRILEAEGLTEEKLKNRVIVFGGNVTGDLDVLNGYNFTQVEDVFENKLDISPVPEKGAISYRMVVASGVKAPKCMVEYHDDCSVFVGGDIYYASRKV